MQAVLDSCTRQAASRDGSNMVLQESPTSCLAVSDGTSSQGKGAAQSRHQGVATRARDDSAAHFPPATKKSVKKSSNALMPHAMACKQTLKAAVTAAEGHAVLGSAGNTEAVCGSSLEDEPRRNSLDSAMVAQQGVLNRPSSDGQADLHTGSLPVWPVPPRTGALPTIAAAADPSGPPGPSCPPPRARIPANHSSEAATAQPSATAPSCMPPKAQVPASHTPEAANVQPSAAVPEPHVACDVAAELRGSKQGARGRGACRGRRAGSERSWSGNCKTSGSGGHEHAAGRLKGHGRGRGGRVGQGGRRPFHVEEHLTSAAATRVQSGGAVHDTSLEANAAGVAPLEHTSQLAIIEPMCPWDLVQLGMCSAPAGRRTNLSNSRSAELGSSGHSKARPLQALWSDVLPSCTNSGGSPGYGQLACARIASECTSAKTVCGLDKQPDQIADVARVGTGAGFRMTASHGNMRCLSSPCSARPRLPASGATDSDRVQDAVSRNPSSDSDILTRVSSEGQSTSENLTKCMKRSPQGPPWDNFAAASGSGPERETFTSPRSHNGPVTRLGAFGPFAVPLTHARMSFGGLHTDTYRRQIAAETAISSLCIQHLHSLGVAFFGWGGPEFIMERVHDERSIEEAKDWLVLPESSRTAIERFPSHLRVRCFPSLNALTFSRCFYSYVECHAGFNSYHSLLELI
jgi:hypothetical protein